MEAPRTLRHASMQRSGSSMSKPTLRVHHLDAVSGSAASTSLLSPDSFAKRVAGYMLVRGRPAVWEPMSIE